MYEWFTVKLQLILGFTPKWFPEEGGKEWFVDNKVICQVNFKLISSETNYKFKVTLKIIWCNTKFNLVLLEIDLYLLEINFQWSQKKNSGYFEKKLKYHEI